MSKLIYDVFPNAPVIDESEHFAVLVAMLPEDKLKQYIILNKQYGVVEFACNNEYIWREWLTQMETKLGEKISPPSPSSATLATVSSIHSAH